MFHVTTCDQSTVNSSFTIILTIFLRIQHIQLVTMLPCTTGAQNILENDTNILF